jgi:hypothetical protein
VTPTKNIDTTLASQNLPLELLRLLNSHRLEEPAAVSMLSGMVAARQPDDVICPLLIRRNLVVPAHHGSVARDGWRVQ